MLIRDAVDYVDWVAIVGTTLHEVRKSLLDGTYRPTEPARFEMPKARGAFRLMTIPAMRDVLVYRLISDEALKRALLHKVPGAFFSRRHTATPVGRTFTLRDDPYLRFYNIWIRYQEYRTRTLLNQPYEILVTTDIVNYFDSIPHTLLQEYLSPLGLPRKALSLLGLLLENLKPSTGHSRNPEIGIPVDEFDCSRQLAHIFLFEHDRRMVAHFGKDRYVRWMDDQNIGSRSRTEARFIVNQLTRSLASQRLTLNSGKTKFLSKDEVHEHFHLDHNMNLNEWDSAFKSITPRNVGPARADLEQRVAAILPLVDRGDGQWEKILKRIYGYAARVQSPVMDDRVQKDLVRCPDLAERIFLSLAVRNEGSKMEALFTSYLGQRESLYESVEASFFDACLLLNAPTSMENRMWKLAWKFARGEMRWQSSRPYGKASAILCLYWWDIVPAGLAKLFRPDEALNLPTPVSRAWLATVSARSASWANYARERLVGNGSDDLGRLSAFLLDIQTGRRRQIPVNWSLRRSYPLEPSHYDARAWLQFELIARGASRPVKMKFKSYLAGFSRYARTRQEHRVLRRLKGLLQ